MSTLVYVGVGESQQLVYVDKFERFFLRFFIKISYFILT